MILYQLLFISSVEVLGVDAEVLILLKDLSLVGCAFPVINPCRLLTIALSFMFSGTVYCITSKGLRCVLSVVPQMFLLAFEDRADTCFASVTKNVP